MSIARLVKDFSTSIVLAIQKNGKITGELDLKLTSQFDGPFRQMRLKDKEDIKDLQTKLTRTTEELKRTKTDLDGERNNRKRLEGEVARLETEVFHPVM